jgi:hypothetical protein
MGNPIVSADFIRLMDTNLDQVSENELKPYQDMIGRIFGSQSSDKKWTNFYGVGAVPDIPKFNGSLDFLPVAPGFFRQVEPAVFAGGLQFEKQFIDDNQYDVLTDRQAGLIQALGRTKEKYASRALGYGFTNNPDFVTQDEEGVAMFSSAHLTKSGVSTASGFDNTYNVAVSKSAIAAMAIKYKMLRNDIGELYDSEADTIICPTALTDTVCEALGYDARSGASSEKDPDSANNKINSQYKRFKVIEWKRLDEFSTKNWFMVNEAMMKKHLIWLDRIKQETNTWTDNYTFAVLQSIYSRFGWGFRDWRFGIGANVS